MIVLTNLLKLVLLLVLVFGIPTFFQYLIDKKEKEKQRILEKEERIKERNEKWEDEREEREERIKEREERRILEELKKDLIKTHNAEIEKNLGIKLGQKKLHPSDFLANPIQEPKDRSKSLGIKND
mgnify:FL=1